MTTLLDAINTAVNAAEAAAQAALDAAKTNMDAAVAAVPTSAGDCLEGMILLDDAWGSVAAAFDQAGRAESLRDVVQLGGLTLTGLVGAIDFSSIAANVSTKATAATTHASDAKTYVLTREQIVRDAYKSCVTAGVLGPLLGVAQACVSSSKDALNAAITNVADPQTPPGSPVIPSTTLQGMVSALIARASTMGLDNGGDGLGCNLGVQQLALAVGLIDDVKTKAATLTTCLGELGAVAPADPLIGQGQSVLTAAQSQITAAQHQLDSDPAVFTAWMNRAHCLLRSSDIVAKVRDESGDEQGEGVQVTLHNPVIDALLPLPAIPLGTTVCPGSQVTFSNVPLAALPVAPPAGAPPKPPGIPDLPSTATLVFNVARGGGRVFAASVDPSGLVAGGSRTTITLQLDEVSSDTSC